MLYKYRYEHEECLSQIKPSIILNHWSLYIFIVLLWVFWNIPEHFSVINSEHISAIINLFFGFSYTSFPRCVLFPEDTSPMRCTLKEKVGGWWLYRQVWKMLYWPSFPLKRRCTAHKNIKDSENSYRKEILIFVLKHFPIIWAMGPHFLLSYWHPWNTQLAVSPL